jgi:hypothetical protein
MKVQDSNNNVVVFQSDPVDILCQYCKCKTISKISYSATYLGFVLFLINLFIFGSFWGLIFTPIIFFVTKNIIHKC